MESAIKCYQLVFERASRLVLSLDYQQDFSPVVDGQSRQIGNNYGLLVLLWRRKLRARNPCESPALVSFSMNLLYQHYDHYHHKQLIS